MPNYATNRQWSDQFLPEVKRLVGAHLLEAAPADQDMREATDLMMLDARDRRVAVRVRRPGFAERFPNDFTLRAKIPSGGQTELSKIVNGKGDWMFYAHAANDTGMLSAWYLIDLRAFRAALIRASQHPLRYGEQYNADGSSFVWFDIRSFPNQPPLVVASSAGSTQAPVNINAAPKQLSSSY